jgi:hypothetical protein
MAEALDNLPGFRRRFRVAPAPGQVRAELEDDFHHMRVTLDHADGVITQATGKTLRAPWTTCPGAELRLRDTFTGVALPEAAHRGEKFTNCTHLHDLALLAARHAGDEAATTYDILTSDPQSGRSETELRINGAPTMRWGLEGGLTLTSPPEIAGLTLLVLGRWIGKLPPRQQEQARMLRWGSIVSHGRSIPLEDQSDATKLPPNCYTFQPENAVRAKRVGEIRDFSAGGPQPLEPRA